MKTSRTKLATNLFLTPVHWGFKSPTLDIPTGRVDVSLG